jgi:hypothetical protein
MTDMKRPLAPRLSGGRCAWVLLLVPGAAGCMTPPCEGGDTATASAASGAGTTSVSGAATTSASTASSTGSGAVGDRLLVWDGDKAGGGKGWSNCDKLDQKCKASIAKVAGVGVNSTAGLDFHAEGPGWLGIGWNWFGWWPETAATDVSAYSNLTFQIRVEGKSPDLAPNPDSVTVSLACNAKTTTADVLVHKYMSDFADGQWHRVVVPIADMRQGTGAQFDPKTTWEFRMGAWSDTPRDYNIYVDDIAFEK